MLHPTNASAPLAPHVWRITVPLAHRPRSVHAYLARLGHGGFLLVDGGVDSEAAWAVVDGAVRGIAGEWPAVAVHVVTHMHVDHVGLAKRARAAGARRLVMGRLDAERAAHALANPEDEAAYRARLLARCGAPPEFRTMVEAQRGRDSGLGGFASPDERLDGEGGELRDAPGWRWIWTPGHTAGHVSLYRSEGGVLIAGDALLPRITPTIGVNPQRADPVGDYLGTLDRLAALRPALALPGHGDPLDEPVRRIDELRDATHAENERVFACIGSEPAAAWAVCLRRHPDAALPVGVRMLALREALAHLEHLALRGAVVADEDAHGAARFRVA